MGISATIALATHAREQFRVGIQACDAAADAVDRGVAMLGTTEDAEGPLVASRSAAATWRDELRTIARELTQIADELGQFAADLEAIQQRLSPALSRSGGG
jgi:hypothetical protein